MFTEVKYSMEIAKLTSKGQITIPKAVRDELGVDTGDKLIFIKCEQGFLVCNGDNFSVPAAEVEPVEEVSSLPPREERPAAKAKRVPDYWDDEEYDEPEERAKKTDKDKKKKKKKKK